jgi:ATP-dependent exoDNAse (exonuclease V) beta subunit
MAESTRDQIVGSAEGWLTKNVYADAGAGTGKTSALVDRIINLLLTEEIRPENIVAVTFTVTAASELRQRVREALEKRRFKMIEEKNIDLIPRINGCIESLDSAFIGTIHSFAQKLLTERPIEAGLPPVFEVSNPVESTQQFEQAWSEWIDGTALENSEFRSAVLDLQMLGLDNPLQELQDLANEFREDYDLVEAVAPLKANSGSKNVIKTLSAILSDLEDSLGYKSYCEDRKHVMLLYLDGTVKPIITTIKESLESDDRGEQLFAISLVTGLNANRGNQDGWNELEAGGPSALKEVKTLLKKAKDTGQEAREIIAEKAVVLVTNMVADMVLGFVKSQCDAGVIGFHDLLVLSCRMLEENPEVREDFRRQYTRILIDEFQDTDPLQLQLAILLSCRPGKQTPDSGRLFVVGDPKQSIYRFRRADLPQLSHMVESLQCERKVLDHNYRSHPEILKWVNNVFEPLFTNANDEKQTSVPVQADYDPLQPGLKSYLHASQPRVLIAGEDDNNANAFEAHVAQAKDIARLAASVGSGAWNVTQGTQVTRKSTYRDLAVLFPYRTVLPYIQDEFAALGIPYVLEGQAAPFESQVILDLFNCLAAIDDPTDQVAIVASLKSGVWGFSDQDLYDWVKAGHKFDYASGVPEINDKNSEGVLRIHEALTKFDLYHSQRHLYTTAGLIETIVRDRKVREVSALINNDENEIRLVDMFIEMARSMQNVGTGSIREFIRWVEDQTESEVKVAEGALANNEIDAVRMMTIYASKGLEFPIATIAGLEVASSSGGGKKSKKSLIKSYSGNPEVSVQLGSKPLGMRTSNHTTMKERESLFARAELDRLAYVASTRARDHLILNVHQSTGKGVGNTLGKSIKEKGGNKSTFPAFPLNKVDLTPTLNDARKCEKKVKRDIFDWSTASEWNERTSNAVHQSLNRGYTTPSQLANHDWGAIPKSDDNSENRELDSAQRGRAATRIGSAVHQVLQDINFDDTSDIQQLVTSAIQAWELEEDPANIEMKVRNTLEAPILQGVSESHIIHEAWVAAKIDDLNGNVLEGSIDLLIRHADDSFSIVDFKTDSVSGTDLEERAGQYEPQLGGYVLILESLKIEVARAILLFSDGGDEGGYRQFEIEDLVNAKNRAVSQAKIELGI